MKTIFVNTDFSHIIKQNCALNVVPLPHFDKLDAPVSAHADMLIFVLDNKIFLYEEYYLINKNIFDNALNSNYEIVLIKKKCQKNYPNDVALNVLRVGNTIFSSLNNTAEEILSYAKSKGYKLVNVNQGYSACSTLVLDERTAITADKGIYQALVKNGKDALLIEEGGIALQGYDYGFIGGASFVVDDTVYFMGNIEKHPSYTKIKEKTEFLKMKIFSISPNDVFDFGGVIGI